MNRLTIGEFLLQAADECVKALPSGLKSSSAEDVTAHFKKTLDNKTRQLLPDGLDLGRPLDGFVWQELLRSFNRDFLVGQSDKSLAVKARAVIHRQAVVNTLARNGVPAHLLAEPTSRKIEFSLDEAMGKTGGPVLARPEVARPMDAGHLAETSVQLETGFTLGNRPSKILATDAAAKTPPKVAVTRQKPSERSDLSSNRVSLAKPPKSGSAPISAIAPKVVQVDAESKAAIANGESLPRAAASPAANQASVPEAATGLVESARPAVERFPDPIVLAGPKSVPATALERRAAVNPPQSRPVRAEPVKAPVARAASPVPQASHAAGTAGRLIQLADSELRRMKGLESGSVEQAVIRQLRAQVRPGAGLHDILTPADTERLLGALELESTRGELRTIEGAVGASRDRVAAVRVAIRSYLKPIEAVPAPIDRIAAQRAARLEKEAAEASAARVASERKAAEAEAVRAAKAREGEQRRIEREAKAAAKSSLTRPAAKRHYRHEAVSAPESLVPVFAETERQLQAIYPPSQLKPVIARLQNVIMTHLSETFPGTETGAYGPQHLVSAAKVLRKISSDAAANGNRTLEQRYAHYSKAVEAGIGRFGCPAKAGEMAAETEKGVVAGAAETTSAAGRSNAEVEIGKTESGKLPETESAASFPADRDRQTSAKEIIAERRRADIAAARELRRSDNARWHADLRRKGGVRFGNETFASPEGIVTPEDWKDFPKVVSGISVAGEAPKPRTPADIANEQRLRTAIQERFRAIAQHGERHGGYAAATYLQLLTGSRTRFPGLDLPHGEFSKEIVGKMEERARNLQHLRPDERIDAAARPASLAGQLANLRQLHCELDAVRSSGRAPSAAR